MKSIELPLVRPDVRLEEVRPDHLPVADVAAGAQDVRPGVDELLNEGFIAVQEVAHQGVIETRVQQGVGQQIVDLAVVDSQQVEGALDPRGDDPRLAGRLLGPPDVRHVRPPRRGLESPEELEVIPALDRVLHRRRLGVVLVDPAQLLAAAQLPGRGADRCDRAEVPAVLGALDPRVPLRARRAVGVVGRRSSCGGSGRSRSGRRPRESWRPNPPRGSRRIP